MEKKKWYRSKMLWTNVIGIAIIIVSTTTANEELVQTLLAAEGSLLAVINVILRLITNQGLQK